MPTPAEVQREAEDAVRQFAMELGKQDRGIGVRTPPKIEVSTTTFEQRAVNLSLDRAGDAARSLEGPPALLPPPEGPTGACCLPGGLGCNILTAFQCSGLGGVYHGDGSVCSPDPC